MVAKLLTVDAKMCVSSFAPQSIAVSDFRPGLREETTHATQRSPSQVITLSTRRDPRASFFLALSDVFVTSRRILLLCFDDSSRRAAPSRCGLLFVVRHRAIFSACDH